MSTIIYVWIRFVFLKLVKQPLMYHRAPKYTELQSPSIPRVGNLTIDFQWLLITRNRTYANLLMGKLFSKRLCKPIVQAQNYVPC